jgi:hypothetical protein
MAKKLVRFGIFGQTEVFRLLVYSHSSRQLLPDFRSVSGFTLTGD